MLINQRDQIHNNQEIAKDPPGPRVQREVPESRGEVKRAVFDIGNKGVGASDKDRDA